MSVYNVTAEEIRNWPINDGWHVCPSSGIRVKIGKGAMIGKGATIGEGARIGERARIGEGARIGERARIGEGITIARSPTYVQGTRYFVSSVRDDYSVLQSGCIIQPLEWWRNNMRQVAAKNGYSVSQIKEHEIYLEMYGKLYELHKAEVTT